MSALFQIEEIIEEIYCRLIALENAGKTDGVEYNSCISILLENMYEEHQIMNKMSLVDRLKLKNWLLLYCDPQVESCITLGEEEDAYYHRLINLIDYSIEDKAYEYARVLKYDLNNILLAFIDRLIDNPAYKKIRVGLLIYKYNLYFLHPETEFDFISHKDLKKFSLEVQNYRNEKYPSSTIVDRAYLLLEGMYDLTTIYEIENELENNNRVFLMAVISIINLLSRLALCNEEIIDSLYVDFEEFLADEELHPQTIKLVNEMMDILKEIKEKIDYKR